MKPSELALREMRAGLAYLLRIGERRQEGVIKSNRIGLYRYKGEIDGTGSDKNQHVPVYKTREGSEIGATNRRTT